MMYNAQSIVFYKTGKPTYIQIFLLNEAFDFITNHYKKKYVPPTDVVKRQIEPFAKQRPPNTAMVPVGRAYCESG